MGGRIIRCAMTDCACHLRIETMRTLIGLWLVLSLGSSSIAGPLPRRNEERDLREEDRKRPAILGVRRRRQLGRGAGNNGILSSAV